MLVKLSKVCDKLPSAIYITGVTGRDGKPLASGGFADIFRANYNGKTVALKRLRSLRNARKRDANHRVRTSGSRRESKGRRFFSEIGSRSSVVEAFEASLCIALPWNRLGVFSAGILHGVALDEAWYDIKSHSTCWTR